MRLLIAAAAVLLSGCWEGTSLYSDSDGRPALGPGLYRVTGHDPELPLEIRVSSLPSGLTQFESKGEIAAYGFVPLDSARGTFVVWDTGQNEGSGVKQDQVYLLLQRQSDGSFVVYLPSCTDDEAEIARKSGAAVGSGIVPVCQFPNRASLETAMRLFRPNAKQEAFRLIPIGTR